MISLALLSLLSLASPESAAAVGAEIQISNLSPDAIPPAPSAASNGSVTLVVWLDATNLQTNGTDVVGARVAADGTILDPTPIVIARDTNGRNQGQPVVAAAGSTFLVAFTDYPAGPVDLMARRIRASDGAVLDTAAITLARGVSNDYEPALASDGASWLAAWTDQRGADTGITGARIGLDGSLLDPDGFTISAAAGDQAQPALGSDGRGYLVAFTDYSSGPRVVASRIFEGRVVDGSTTVVATRGTAPSIASNGASYLVAWSDRRAPQADIWAARLDSNGAPAGEPFAVCTMTGDQTHPRAASAAGEYVVLWFDGVTSGFAERGAPILESGAAAIFTLQDPVENGLVAAAGGNDGILVAYPHDALRARTIHSSATTPAGEPGWKAVMQKRVLGRTIRTP